MSVKQKHAERTLVTFLKVNLISHFNMVYSHFHCFISADFRIVVLLYCNDWVVFINIIGNGNTRYDATRTLQFYTTFTNTFLFPFTFFQGCKILANTVIGKITKKIKTFLNIANLLF